MHITWQGSKGHLETPTPNAHLRLFIGLILANRCPKLTRQHKHPLNACNLGVMGTFHLDKRHTNLGHWTPIVWAQCSEKFPIQVWPPRPGEELLLFGSSPALHFLQAFPQHALHLCVHILDEILVSIMLATGYLHNQPLLPSHLSKNVTPHIPLDSMYNIGGHHCIFSILINLHHFILLGQDLLPPQKSQPLWRLFVDNGNLQWWASPSFLGWKNLSFFSGMEKPLLLFWDGNWKHIEVWELYGHHEFHWGFLDVAQNQTTSKMKKKRHHHMNLMSHSVLLCGWLSIGIQIILLKCGFWRREILGSNLTQPETPKNQVDSQIWDRMWIKQTIHLFYAMHGELLYKEFHMYNEINNGLAPIYIYIYI